MNLDFPQTSVPDSSENQLYDLSYIEAAGQEDHDFIKKLVTIFIEVMPVNIEEINHFASINDWPHLRKTAHKIKSSIDLLGIKSLMETIKYLEMIGDGDDSLKQHIDFLNSQMQRVIAQLRKLI